MYDCEWEVAQQERKKLTAEILDETVIDESYSNGSNGLVVKGENALNTMFISSSTSSSSSSNSSSSSSSSSGKDSRGGGYFCDSFLYFNVNNNLRCT